MRRTSDGSTGGENEEAVFDVLAREKIVIKVFDEAANCRYGLLSQSERSEVLARVDEILPGHLVDVDGLRMTIRHRGAERSVDVEEGTWLIACTAHIKDRVHRPILSGEGLVCAPQNCLGFSGTSAYFVTHAWYRDELAPVAAVHHVDTPAAGVEQARLWRTADDASGSGAVRGRERPG